MRRAIAPQPGLRAERPVRQSLRLRIMQVALFDVNEGRKPLVRFDVHPPAIEIEIVAHQERLAVGTIEPHDVVILIFHPDSSDETSFVVLTHWTNVEDQTANLPQKFAPDVLKSVVLTIEARRVHVDHLQEPARHETYIQELSPIFGQLSLQPRVIFEWLELHSLRELRSPEEVFVPVRYCLQLLVQADILNIRFHQG